MFFSATSEQANAESNDQLITTVAGDGSPSNVGQPFGVEFGPDGGLFICDVENHRIHRLDPDTQQLTIIAGTGEKGIAATTAPRPKSQQKTEELKPLLPR